VILIAHIAADNPDADDRWIGKLFDAFEAVGQTPDQFREFLRVPDIIL